MFREYRNPWLFSYLKTQLFICYNMVMCLIYLNILLCDDMQNEEISLSSFVSALAA